MSDKLPAFQFYTGDWRKDPNLSRCTKAEKGVWIDMLCLMHECEDRGILISGNVPWTDNDISVAIGGDISENLACISGLLRKGVLHRSEKTGALFCKRMIRDEQKRKLCSEAGKRGGGNPTFKGQTKGVTKGRHKGISKQNANPSSSSSSSSFSSKKNTPPTPSRGSGGVSERFEEFWKAYPKKRSRGLAEKSWAKIKPSEQLHNAIMQSLERAKTSEDWTKDNGKFIPHPASWLTAKGWEDEYETAQPPPNQREKPKGCEKCQFSGLISPMLNGKVQTFRCDCDLGKTRMGLPEFSPKARGDPPEKVEPVDFAAIAKMKNISREIVKGI